MKKQKVILKGPFIEAKPWKGGRIYPNPYLKPMKQEYKYLITSNAPENYASKREVRSIWAKSVNDGMIKILSESVAFGVYNIEFLGDTMKHSKHKSSKLFR